MGCVELLPVQDLLKVYSVLVAHFLPVAWRSNHVSMFSFTVFLEAHVTKCVRLSYVRIFWTLWSHWSFLFSSACLRNSLWLIFLYVFIFSSRRSFMHIFFFCESLLTLSYFFFSEMCKVDIFFSLFLNLIHQVFHICLYLYIHTPFFPWHALHIINHTSSHHRLFVVSIFISLSTLLTIMQGVTLTNKLYTHYSSVQCLWKVHHAIQYTIFTCPWSSFLETLIFCCPRILGPTARRELNYQFCTKVIQAVLSPVHVLVTCEGSVLWVKVIISVTSLRKHSTNVQACSR